MTMNEQKFNEAVDRHYDRVLKMENECRSLLAEHSFEERTNISLEKCKVGDTGGFCTALFIPSNTMNLYYNVTNGDSSADLKGAIHTKWSMYIALEDESWESALGAIFHDIQCGFPETTPEEDLKLKEIGLTSTDILGEPKTIEEIVAHIVRVEEKLKDIKLPKENQ